MVFQDFVIPIRHIFHVEIFHLQKIKSSAFSSLGLFSALNSFFSDPSINVIKEGVRVFKEKIS